MTTLPSIEKLKKKLSKKKDFSLFYRKLFKKIESKDKFFYSFISLNKKIKFKKNKNLSLQNIPIAIKDLIHLKGTKCTSGSLVYKNRKSLKNAIIVDRLNKAGCQIIGKNNLVEFAYGSWGTNTYYGTPINPKDQKHKRVCGGSSSGSASCVANGFSAVSLGTDTGGSIRVPAAYCGVYGLKTSHGRIPLNGVEKLTKEFDTIGIFANYIDDIDDVFKVIVNHYKRRKFNNFKLIFFPEQFYKSFSNTIFSKYKKFLKKLKKNKFELSQVQIARSNNFFVKKTTEMMSYRGFQLFKKIIFSNKFPINDDVKDRLMLGKNISYKKFLVTKLQRQKLIKHFNNVIQNDILIAPVTKTVAPKISQVNQKFLPSEYCRFVNYLDLCSITFVIEVNKMPIALQAIAKKGNDEKCIAFIKDLVSKKILKS